MEANYTQLQLHDLHYAILRLPRPVLVLMKTHGRKLVAGGGFVRAVIAQEAVNDVDLFVGDASHAKSMAQELAVMCKKAYPPKVHETKNAFTIYAKIKLVTQFIHRWTYDTPEALMNSFDFTVAKAAFWWNEEAVKWESLCDSRFYPDLAAKRLVYAAPDRNEDAGGSFLRLMKFYQRGYRAPLSTMGAVMARLISGVDQNSVKIIDGSDGTALGSTEEQRWAKALSGLLVEVDPLIDPDHIAHERSLAENTSEESDADEE